jgi:hemolysin activation/secretion protein
MRPLNRFLSGTSFSNGLRQGLPTPAQRKSRLRHSLSAAALAVLLVQAGVAQAQAPSAAPSGPTIDIRSYVVDGENPLSASETEAVLAPFAGSGKTLADIEGAASAMERAMRERGWAFNRMLVPAQKPVDGQVRLQVVGIALGKVEVQGNEHFTTENIRNSLGTLVEGQVPEVQLLGRDVTASNANPAKQTTVTFKESAEPGKIDAVVRVKDSPPMIFFTGLSTNQGLSGKGDASNTHRITAGFQHANLFDRDHVLTASYTTDPTHVGDVDLVNLYYQVPIYGTGMNLSAAYVHSNVDSGRVQQGLGVFDVSGSGRFMSLRLTKALSRTGAWQHVVGVGLEDRLFENSSTFNGNRINPDVGSRVLTLQYSFRNEPSWGIVAGNLDYALNIGGGSSNSAARHAANGGDRNWSAWRFGLETLVPVADWTVSARLRGQYSRDLLIPGEYFGLGGANSVRGFPDRAVAGEYGIQWTLEGTGPGMGEWAVRPVAFVEGGTAHDRSGGNETIASIGAGLRFAYNNRLQMSLDIAKPIDGDSTAPTPRRARLHFAMGYRF